MVFQDYALFPHLNVEKNISFGLSRDEIKSGRLEEVLSMCNLETYRNKFPQELSGGQQQRVSLARALAPKPEVILLDEPFTSLDAHMARDLREEVVSLLRQTETTAIIVTHDQVTGGYHGRTAAPLSVTSNDNLKKNFNIFKNIFFFPYPGTYKDKKNKYTEDECILFAINFLKKTKIFHLRLSLNVVKLSVGLYYLLRNFLLLSLKFLKKTM